MKRWKHHIFVRILLVMASTVAAGIQGSAAQGVSAPSVDPHDISGFWALTFDSRMVPPAKLAPGVTKAMLDQHAKTDAHATRWCNLLGTPFVMDPGMPIDIRQGTREIIIDAETSANPRHMYFRSAHINPDIFDPSTNGDSIAHWEGDVLIVDTVGFAEDNGLTEIPGGGFRTAQSHLVERYHLVENGSILSVTFTWEDPTMFRTPHSYEFRYYRLPVQYQPMPMIPCNAYDGVRAKFLEGPGVTDNHAISNR